MIGAAFRTSPATKRLLFNLLNQYQRHRSFSTVIRFRTLASIQSATKNLSTIYVPSNPNFVKSYSTNPEPDSRSAAEEPPSTAPNNAAGASGAGYLPKEFICSEQWAKRLDSSILSRIELDDLFYEIDKKYAQDQTISPIDVDLYVNKVTTPDNLEELEELVYRLRKSPVASDTLESTGHAVIRTLLEHGKFDTLMRILDDRMNYGVFIDHHSGSMLMDKFLADGNHKDAAKVASLFMLEEDFENPICKMLALTSCLKYVESLGSKPEEPVAEVAEPKKHEEEERVRVRYQRNPYFDDHFELTNQQNIAGKTLVYISLQLTEDPTVQKSVELLGYALFDKWNKVERLLLRFRDEKTPIIDEVLQKLNNLLNIRLAELEASPNKTLPKPKIKIVPGLQVVQAEVDKAFEKLQWDEQTSKPLPRIKEFLSQNPKFNTIFNISLLPKVEELLQTSITQNLDSQIKFMTETYENWDEVRKEEFENQITRIKDVQKLLEIRDKKKELQDKEDVIFFFDNEEKWMMELEKPKPHYTNVVDGLKKKKRGLPPTVQ